MSIEFPTDPRKALETSLTALLLGELPEDQARFLRQAIATDPELAKTFESLKKTIVLVREAQVDSTAEPPAQNDSFKLSDERRAALLQHFKTVHAAPFKAPVRRQADWLMPVAASVAVLLLVAGLVVPALSRSKSRSMASRDLESVHFLADGRKVTPLPGSRSGEVRKLLAENELINRQASVALTESSSAGPPLEAPNGTTTLSSIVLPSDSKADALNLGVSESLLQPSSPNLSYYHSPSHAGAPLSAPTPQTPIFDSYDSFSTFRQVEAGNRTTPTLGDQPQLGPLLQTHVEDDKAANLPMATNTPSTDQWAVSASLRGYYNDGAFGGFSTFGLSTNGQALDAIKTLSDAQIPALQQQWAEAESKSPLLKEEQRSFALEEGNTKQLSDRRLRDALRNSGDSAVSDLSGLAAPPLPAEPALKSRVVAGKDVTVAFDETLGKTEKETLARKMSREDSTEGTLTENKKTADRAKLAKHQISAQLVIEQDNAPATRPVVSLAIPQPEILTQTNPFSTFSLNVSDVSFKLAAASLEKGVMPEAASIRSEEFINAFDYRDPEPAPGAPVAFAFERAQYPFAQNRDLLRFSIKTAAVGRQNGRPLNLVLLLDNSGSMERADRVRIIHEALGVLATQLQAQDTFSVVTFARTARLWVDGVPGDQAGRVANELSSLTPQGGTNLEEAMNLAYQTALRHYATNGINRVVLLTDGAANLGDTNPTVLKQQVETNRKQGIALDCFGIGWEGYNDDLLEELTRNGDGRYGFLNTPEEAASGFAAQLAGALQVAASDVKVQVEFNPARVTSYRQIGYARHQLTKEQFRDNSVDAAEIGAAEAGNALYVIESNLKGEGPLATVRVRYKLPGTTEYHEHEWAVPFAGNAVALDQASPSIRLAAAASAFSEWLAQSPFAAEVTPDRLLGFFNGVPATYGVEPRPQKLEWMIQQAKALSGK